MDHLDPSAAVSLLEQASKKYICTLCVHPSVNVFESMSLELHCRICHPTISFMACVYCLRQVSVTSIEKHIDRHFSLGDDRPFLCPFCPSSFNTSRALAQHASIDHPSSASLVFYKCSYCDKPTTTFLELADHLSESCLSLYHCHYPQCYVKSVHSDLIMEHFERCHGTRSPCVLSTRLFYCSLSKELQDTKGTNDDHSGNLPANKEMCSQCSLFCPKCCFGTINMETFVEHLVSCRAVSGKSLPSLSITCTLFHCAVCGWTASAKNMLEEHIRVFHSSFSEIDGILTEEFTVPLSEETINDNSSSVIPFLPPSTRSASNDAEVLSAVTSRLNVLSHLFSTANLSSLLSPASLSNNLMPQPTSRMDSERQAVIQSKQAFSIATCPTTQSSLTKDHLTSENWDETEGDHFNKRPQPKPSTGEKAPSFIPHSSTLHSSGESHLQWNFNPLSTEFVQLYFNEPAFVAAYSKSGKFGGSHRAPQSAELSGIVQKLRRFAGYRVPILGRSNQRRVAGCPECMKQFNHGFTDLKKHLLVTHLNVRRDIARFALEFTISTRTHMTKTKVDNTSDGYSLPGGKSHWFGLRGTSRTPLHRIFRKKSTVHLSHTITPSRRPKSAKHDPPKSSTIPLATVSTSGLPTLVSSPVHAYSGCAPVHRVIPGTGVSDQHEDMKTLNEVISEAPVGRGGIVPLDDVNNPNFVALSVASQSQCSISSGNETIFLPKLGRQRIQLAYSYPVFKRLLESYQVPVAEQIQLINRMNHYAQMHVIMEVLVPGGAQKRFSCPTCMYTSVHSLADIRKHIMGSHCGISTKRFRLCLRASRHDSTTYRLHSDERMIRFVEDHRRRQLQSSDTHTANSNASVDGVDGDPSAEERRTRRSHGRIRNTNEHPVHSATMQSQEELETMTIEADLLYDERQLDKVWASDRECDNRFLSSTACDDPGANNASSHSASPFESVPIAMAYDAPPDEISRRSDEIYRRVELPFSSHVLRVLLEREGMLEQYNDLVEKMQVYSGHHLTVISRDNRIHAYVCVCGRRFPVVREDSESDIRPASLADCRRHILGVHVRIPQELLTLCCQASRISKESGYKLHSDSSLLAMAEQYKFRSTRLHTSKDSSSSGPDLSKPIGSSGDVFCPKSSRSISCSTSQTANTAAVRNSNDYTSKGVDLFPIPPLVKPESIELPRGSAIEKYPPRSILSNDLTEKSSHSSQDAEVCTSHGDPDKESVEERHSGLDLEAPRRILTADEAILWSQMLSLPESWTLERIVRLPYNSRVFDEQLKIMLSDNEAFIQTLHDRMRVYSRHSVYIARLSTSANSTQRIYACCACLTTSQHGFGDVRKHILGVHAHVPERFKTLAMNSSRLNREDYSLQAEPQLLASSNSPWRSTTGSTTTSSRASQSGSPNSDLLGGCSRVLRRRQRSNDFSPTLRSHALSPSGKKFRSHLQSDGDEKALCDRKVAEQTPHPVSQVSSDILNCDSVSSACQMAARENHTRPPIILTLPRPKAFHSSQSPDRFDSTLSSSDTAGHHLSPSGEHFTTVGSRSRRSMILKAKRPCPTTT
ncbi:uncharacterized protein DEA37_0002858 [Paragonimus westermani]|uniref:C2H2-type domain-containing protein n=1 Tax=Paragonimus westermani TaxID=34504 RepID=A0A5J4P2X8_9TREM|nr:uncharacterized protein DEA37_0002858 [Paragonimus westermani]